METYTAHGMTWSVYADPIPLRVEDLIDIDYDGWSTEADVDWSPWPPTGSTAGAPPGGRRPAGAAL